MRLIIGMYRAIILFRLCIISDDHNQKTINVIGGYTMKVTVDQDECIGSGNCEAIAPDIFEVRDGKSHVKTANVPGNQEEKVKKAEKECPSGAISVS
jgi:ferredoxin